MPNEYFQFKQFTIEQDKCSMKVCTDSCVFGAWMAEKIAKKSFKEILDIGTGTGLLSLMVAQKTSALIDAIDIDNNAIIQAKENFRLSPWSRQLQASRGDIKSWPVTSQYDCIIANPPFYENDLLPEEGGNKNSKHSNSLRLNELIIAVAGLLETGGLFGVLLPYSRTEYFEKEAIRAGLFTSEKLLVRHSTKHDYFRAILVLERKQIAVQQSELSVKNITNEYSNEFIDLLKDYYLYL